MPWTGFASAALGAAGSLAGGLFGSSGKNSHSYQYYLDRDYNQSQRIAQNQPSWLVEGARRAGLHPLAVLGMPLATGSSHSIGAGPDSDYSWLSDVGQGIGRAAGALLSKEDREKQQLYDETRQKQQLKNNELQNNLLSAQIAQISQDMALQLAGNSARAVNSTSQSPGFQLGVDGRTTRSVIPGQNDATTSSLFTSKPPEIAVSHPQTAFAEAGTHPEIRFSRTALGGYAPVRSQAVTDALEDDLVGSVRYELRNGLGSALSDQRYAPPRSYLPDRGKTGAYYWLYDNVHGDWFPAHVRESRWSKFKKTLGFGR